ncbi:MAG: hypothetical protein JWM87_2334 [Candidatus Eremiobacteraeota bacterium]|nr:hypothetical protein [Candidatus Eremiobacteraeota bacterium]
MTKTTYAICLSALLIAAPLSATAQTTSTDDITVHVGRASRAVQAYGRSRSVEDLRSAVFEMQAAGNLHALKPDTFVAQRRTIVRGWAQLFKVIDDSYDPTYDPNDPNVRPHWHLPDPQDIPDPNARAAAAAAIAANKQKIARATHYLDVQNVDLLAQSSMKAQLNQFRKVEPDGTDADFTMLDGILQQAGLSSVRRTKINRMFYARPGG